MSWQQRAVCICVCLVLHCCERVYSVPENETDTEGGFMLRGVRQNVGETWLTALRQCGCMVKDVRYTEGQTWLAPVGQCALYKCRENGSYSGVSCGMVFVNPDTGCHVLEGNNTVQYPDCCPHVDCLNPVSAEKS